MTTGPILCADDEPYNLGILRMALKEQHSLVFARSGQETLRAVEKHHPALILLDVQMPDMDGYEVCRRLKCDNHTQDIPVIFVTGMAQEIDEKVGFDVGAVDYITKPVSVPIVQARVRTHLSLVRADKLEKSYHDAIHMLGKAGHTTIPIPAPISGEWRHIADPWLQPWVGATSAAGCWNWPRPCTIPAKSAYPMPC